MLKEYKPKHSTSTRPVLAIPNKCFRGYQIITGTGCAHKNGSSLTRYCRLIVLGERRCLINFKTSKPLISFEIRRTQTKWDVIGANMEI